MPNPNTPYGLQAVSYAWGAPYAGATRTYYVPAGNATALFFGDPLLGVTNSSDGNGIPVLEIAAAGASGYISGVFQGITNNAGIQPITLLQSQTPYLAAGQAAYIDVIDDPFVLFKIQENSVGGGGTGGSLVSGAAGRNTNLIAGTGSTVTGFSGWQIDSSVLETTNTGQLRIIQALQEVDNAIGVNCKWLVKINLAQMLNLTGI